MKWTTHAGAVTVQRADCLTALRGMPDASVDAIVTDPPYGLGFMGKAWDELPPGVEWAAECLRVLKPGGHMLAFGGSRTWHRLACAVEDAGFELRDSIAWLYGCLSDDTEVLTTEGWMRYDSAKVGQLALAFDPATGVLEWQSIQHVHRYDHDGEMVRLHSEHTDQLLTPNHRVVLDAESRIPYAGDMRDLWDRVVETERLGEANSGTLLLSGVQRGPTRPGVGHARPQGQQSPNAGELRQRSSEDDRAAEPRVEGRRYRVQEARQLCRRATRQGTGVGAADGAEGRIHHGAPPADGGAVRLPADTAGSHQPREPRPQGQPTGQPDAVAVEQGAQALRVGPDGGRRVLPATRVEATFVDYAGVVWCITVPHGAFIARRNGLIFATGNSGFPKSLDVSKAIDKAAGAERDASILGSTSCPDFPADCMGHPTANGSLGGGVMRHARPTAPATDDARTWQGWGTALKPAFEPIVVARKPLKGTVASNVLAHGTGALNIDGCRVEGAKPDTTRGASVNASSMAGPLGGQGRILDDGRGRWPANVILDESQAEVLDEQSGVSESRRIEKPAAPTPNDRATYNSASDGSMGGPRPARGHDDKGGASRFFYVAKAPKRERPVVDGVAHPTVKPLTLMRWLVRLVTPPGGLVLDPFAGSGTTGEACILEGFRVHLIERGVEYLPLIEARIVRAIPQAP